MAIGRWQDAHEESTHGLNSDLREKLLKKQYKAEKNVWMSVRSSHPFVFPSPSRGCLGVVRVQAFAFTLYITIHRWRHDVKAGLTEEDKPKPAKKAAKAD